LKKVEIESLVKSFILFFISQLILVGALFYIDYKREVQTLDATIFSKMRICSFDLICQEFEIDFASLDKVELYKLYKDKNSLSSYFSIPGSTENALKVYLPKEKYESDVQILRSALLTKFMVVVFVIIILSLLFSFYTISPLRNALRLTEEFIKDILHDFNTPLSTLRLNATMLKREVGENSKIKRIENSVQNILNLQSNLRAYLINHESQKEKFLLKEFLEERVALLDKNYPKIKFSIEVPEVELETNRDSFARIIDNILSNAAKYNRVDGSVELHYENKILEIRDSGKGIKHPKKVFDRFYKEQERGIGIGLHIVKKLCDELSIDISLRSKLQEGSSFFLNLSKIS